MFTISTIMFSVLFFFSNCFSTTFKELDNPNILNFVEFDEKENQVTFKKNIIPLLQDILDEKNSTNEGFFKIDNILTLLGLGSIMLNFAFVFKLFDIANKNSENIESFKKGTIDLIKKITDPMDACGKVLNTLTEKYKVHEEKLAYMMKSSNEQSKITHQFSDKFSSLSDTMYKVVSEILEDQKKIVKAINNYLS